MFIKAIKCPVLIELRPNPGLI